MSAKSAASIEYVKVPRHILEDTRLSLRQKGLMVMAIMQPTGRTIDRKKLGVNPKDPLATIVKTMEELGELGYIKQTVRQVSGIASEAGASATSKKSRSKATTIVLAA